MRLQLLISILTCILITGLQSNAANIQVTKVSQKQAATGVELKNIRKVGIGVHISGVYGTIGTQMDLNFSPAFTTAIGFGLGEDINTFNFQLKRVIRGENILPYASVGFSRWTAQKSGKGVYNKTNPQFLSDKFLSKSEKDGDFAENFLYPGIGIQYLVSRGQWAGTGIYAELNLLVDLDDFNSASVGSIGYSYFF